MRASTPKLPLFGLWFIGSFAVSSGTGQAAYTFTKIADVTNDSTAAGTPLSLNDAGVVAFQATGGPGVVGIYTGSGGALTTIADTARWTELSYASVNNHGVVAFRRGGESHGQYVDGLFIGDGGEPTVVFEATKSTWIDSYWPAINDSAAVAFRGTIRSSLNAVFVVQAPIGLLIRVVDSSGPTFNFSEPKINNAGTIAWSAEYYDGGWGIFSWSEGAIATIVSDGAEFRSISPVIWDLNDGGTLAFLATDASGQLGLFTTNGLSTTPVVETSGPLAGFPGVLRLNSFGVVAFFGALDAGGQGIFAGPDPESDAVILIGDALDDSTVVNFGSGYLDLNDRGPIAFYAALADGRAGIYRADPVSHSVPSVSVWGLGTVGLMLMAGTLLLRRRRLVRQPAGARLLRK